jgi:membrane protease YdiL (CAAX protease family)
MNSARSFTLKDAVYLCCFLIGIRFLADLLLFLFHIRLDLFYNISFLVLVIFTAKKLEKTTIASILMYQPVSVYAFFSLLVMFLGLKIMGGELVNFFSLALPIPQDYFGEPSGVIMIIVNNALFPAFTEEVFFRGILLNRLQYRYSPGKAVTLSALLFGLMHLNPWQFLYAFVIGLFLGWIYIRFKNIWLCMFMHCYNNVLADFLPLPVVLLPNTYGYSLRVIHPLWLDILGIALFGGGLALTLSLVRERKRSGRN